MKLTEYITPSLELDTYHTETHLNALGMSRLEHHNVNYLVYEMNDRVYYFENSVDKFLRLFCVTSKKSFYLT